MFNYSELYVHTSLIPQHLFIIFVLVNNTFVHGHTIYVFHLV